MTMEKGQPPVSAAALGWTRSKTFWGFESSLYFLSCQLLMTAPRLENSTRYRSFSTTMLRSWVSSMGGTEGAAVTEAAGGVAAGVASAGAGVAAEVPLVAGAATPGWFGCGTCAGGFGPKYFVHKMMTAMESRAATRIRSSGVNLSFLGPIGGNWFTGGVLTGGPHALQQTSWNSFVSLAISPGPDRVQICGIEGGNATGVSSPARRRATLRIA